MKINVTVTKEQSLRLLPFMIGVIMSAAWMIIFRLLTAS